MAGYHLCQEKKAAHSYYIESVGLHIYTMEELCFYLWQNIYLVDQTILNEELCRWIRDELGRKKLYRKLHERLTMDGAGNLAGFVLPIFKEIEYLSPEEYKKVQEQISSIEIQPEDLRRKMKADYLVKYEMYGNAIREYYQILKEKNPGKLGVQFYGSVLNNMAAAYGKLFLFEEAADCLWQSYAIIPSRETWNRYLSVLPLYLDKKDYADRLKELSVPQEEIFALESRNAEYIRREVSEKLKKADPKAFLVKEKEKYYKSASS